MDNPALDDDGEVDMILSDPGSDYDSSSDGEDVEGFPADASTLKSRDDKESWSIAPITPAKVEQGMVLDYVHLLLTVSLYFSNKFSRRNLQVDKQRRKTNCSMQMERHDSHTTEKIDWCP